MNHIEQEMILRQTGHRVTLQRLAILDAVREGDGHLSIGEIYRRVHQNDPSIDRSTLYRTLKLFVALKLLVSADIGDGETYYEMTKAHPHHHLVCSQCGKEEELDHTLVQTRLFDAISKEYGFTAVTDHLVLFGLCADCSQAKPAQLS